MQSNQAPDLILNLLYMQLYRTIRRAVTCQGELEKDTMSPWAKNQRAIRFMGALDAEIFQLRDLVEDLAEKLAVELPKRSETYERSRGANARPLSPAGPPIPDVEAH